MNKDRARQPRFSITFKITTLIGFLVVVTAVLVGFWNNQILYKRLVESELDELSLNTASAKIRIEAQLGDLEGDLRFLNTTPPITGLVRAHESGGFDPTEGDTLEQWYSRLQLIIDDMAMAKSNYLQVEFVSLTEGVDSVFSTSSKPGNSVYNKKIKRPEEPELTNDLVRLKPKEIYYSEFNFLTKDLHVSPDVYEIFDIPVIWAAMPVFASDDTLFGYVAINYSMKGILSRYAKTTTKTSAKGFSIYLVDKQGDLIQMIQDRNGGFDFKRHDIRQSYPKLLKAMTSESGILTKMGRDARSAISYTTIRANSKIIPREMKILLAGDYDSIIALPNTSRDVVRIITLSILPILILVGIYISRTITRPLRNVVNAIQAFTEGEANVSLPPPAEDETGILVRAFESMRSVISQRNGLLEESEMRHRTILATIADGLITIDERGSIQTFNQAAERIFGYPVEKIRGCNISKLMPEPDSSAHDSYLKRYLDTGIEHIFGRITERRGLRSDGVVFPMELSVNELKFGPGRSFIGIVRDITERKEAEYDLQHSEAQLREAQRIANLGFWEEDLISHAVFWSDEIYNMHEMSREDFTPTRDTIHMLIHPDDLPGYKNAFQNALKDDVPIDYECRSKTSSGQLLYLHIRGEIRRNEKGEPMQLFGTTLNITRPKLVEEDLRNSQSRASEAQRVGRLGFWELDLVSRDVFWSDGVYAITGVNRDDFLITDETFIDLVHPDDREMVIGVINRPVTGGESLQNLEYRIIRPDDGRERYVLLRSGLSNDAAGHPARILGTIMDITEKVIAEQEIRRYRDIINATQDMMMFVDCNYRYLAVNREFLNCYQLTLDEVIGHHPTEILGKSQFEKISKPLLERALLGDRVDDQHWFQYPGRGSRYVYVSYNPYREDNGTIGGVVINVRDLTENKHYEMELQRAKTRAEEAALTKARFLANMSHELRTPLNAIIGYSEMMKEKAEEIDNQENISDLKKIHTSGEHLLSLVNNILDLSKIEAGKMDLVVEIVNIREIIEAVTATFTPMLEAMGNRIIVNIDDDVDAMFTDAVRLRQCLYNLLSNAIKFTDHGTVTIRVRRSHDYNNSWMIFEVRDTGIGINKENITRIFEAFDQADLEYSEKYGGTGLGLAIVNEIALMMGGEISVTSEPGHGSIFTLQIPSDLKINGTVNPVRSVSIEQIKGMIDTESKRPLVLVIDDDPESLGILNWHLKKGGYQVISADNGDFGLKLARELKPAAIILDVLMPKRNGWDVLTELKSDRDMVHIPIIMCTVVDNATKGLALGASDYIVKPINRTRLLKTLKKYCMSESCRILVVEDDNASREMLERTLLMAGWNVSAATNGREALAALESSGTSLPDVILLDLMMPEMDGFEVVEIVKKNNTWQGIPILIMTAKDLTDADYRRLNGSVAGLLEKGTYSVDELLVQLNSLLNLVKA